MLKVYRVGDHYAFDFYSVPDMRDYIATMPLGRHYEERSHGTSCARTKFTGTPSYKAAERLLDYGCPDIAEKLAKTVCKAQKIELKNSFVRQQAGFVFPVDQLMQPLRNRADMIIDTTGLTVGMLRQKLYNAFMKEASWMPLTVTISSFGFKYGLPIDADTVLDVRFLPNPYYVPELRERTGMDQDVYDYVFSHPDSQEYMTRLVDLFRFLLPRYITEGKTSFVVAVGCTGGHHRSVAVARKLAEDIRSMGYPVELYHRDIK